MICICLQSCGANPAISDGEGRTALHYAVTKQTFECCQVLLECLPKLADTKDGKGRIPLHLAVTAKGNKYVCVCLFLFIYICVSPCAPICCISYTNLSYTSPLYPTLHLPISGSVDILLLLLSVPGVDINCSDCQQTTAVHWAVVHNRPDMLRILLQQ